jgi:membrane-anchored glycerophosphoryl diester phosphodiesterase (GDPDase)
MTDVARVLSSENERDKRNSIQNMFFFKTHIFLVHPLSTKLKQYYTQDMYIPIQYLYGAFEETSTAVCKCSTVVQCDIKVILLCLPLCIPSCD